jgi:hypothetical protein
MTINDIVRQLVRQRAKYLCEYCHSSEKANATRFTMDHILPQSLGGSDDSENLALACQRCNERHYNFIAGIDPQTKEIIPLFNPRQQQWVDHFIWTADGIRILGISPTGRSTCNRLDINDDRYDEDDSIRAARRLWVQAGWHPPQEDPRQE